MLTLRRSAERGHADHGWLDTWHTFSFAEYRDPRWTHFGALRVINQDIVAPGEGFGTHGHSDMEIVTWVLEGALQHKDSMGNGSIIRPGDAQLMSAGTGVLHSEFNASDHEPVHLLQMWVFPEQRGTAPRYGQEHIPEERRRGRLALLASPDGADGSLIIGQDVRLWTAQLDSGDVIVHALVGSQAWLHVARGALTLDGAPLGPGDGAGITETRRLRLQGVEPAEIVLFDLG